MRALFAPKSKILALGKLFRVIRRFKVLFLRFRFFQSWVLFFHFKYKEKFTTE